MLAMPRPIEEAREENPSPGQLAEWLLAVGRSHDRNAFEALFGHFAPRLKSYMLRLGAQADAAEGLAQETMVQVWRKAKLYDSEKAIPAAWIFRVGRNLRIDRLRKQRFYEVDIETAGVERKDREQSADREIEQMYAGYLASLVEFLPGDQKEVVKLAFFEGLSHAEIEQKLSIPLGTVKSRVRLAFGKLRKAMGEER